MLGEANQNAIEVALDTGGTARVSYLLTLILLVWLGGWVDARLPWPRPKRD